MNRILLFCCIVGFNMIVYAQSPTINQSSLPMPGDTFAYMVDLNPTVSFNYNQVNANWNLSALQSDSVKYASYGITSQLSFAANFPNSNLYTYGPGFLYGGLGGGSPYPNNWGYMMFSTNNNGFYTIGFRGDFGYGMTNVIIQPNELLMKTPFTYGDSVFHNSSWEIVFNTVPTDYDTIYRRYTYKYILATGYGTLTTPYGIFTNSLAVKEYLRFYDTVEVKYGSFTITKFLAQADTIFHVHVWSTNKRNNLLTATYNPHNLTCLSIEYLNYEDLNTIPENIINPIAHQFPNPLRSGEICQLNFRANQVAIYNTYGKLIYRNKVNDSSFTVPYLTSGTYIAQFFDSNKNCICKSILIILNE
ncbi:MAG: hypothetical protein N2449_02280 [Bacteroidales bacterium]|nr:hypothetical protein [Bacteroidales bacterium]